MKIVLASNSPRRKEILTEFGYKFTVIKSDFEEKTTEKSPVLTALRFAKGKALSVFSQLKSDKDFKNPIVLGADTVVYFDGNILGKPKDYNDAINTLKTLSGKTHKVVTAYAVLGEKCEVFGYDVSEVTFNNLSDELIREYVTKCKPFDKAGSYGIQDGFNLVGSVRGSVYNVIGLPIEKIKPVLDGIICE